ncbi:MAG: hypothetical protein HPY66_0714 [Firmicutes bacterium]|nr:hypothetical protein [Bacillota bacterium]
MQHSFAITRWVLSLIGVLTMSWLINRLISETEKQQIFAKHNDNTRVEY